MLFEIVFQFTPNEVNSLRGCDLMLFEIVFQFLPPITYTARVVI